MNLVCRLLLEKNFFFNDTATTEIYTPGYTLSLHDALPIYKLMRIGQIFVFYLHFSIKKNWIDYRGRLYSVRSEEHTSELQSR